MKQLDEVGFVVVAGAIDSAHVDRLRRAFEDAPAQKDGTQHVPLFDETLASHPAIVDAARVVFEGGAWRVRDMHGRNPLPGYGQQGLHADWMPRAPGEPTMVLTAIWMLDDFTVENGATRVVPGSHRVTTPLAKSLAQPSAKHRDETIVTGRAGDVLVFNGHVWHSGRRNDSRGPRRCVQMVVQRQPGTIVPTRWQ
jgi:ectoine hydroxylase-related dioxygenase (phytanoyl-CoA dioxygenase family)